MGRRNSSPLYRLSAAPSRTQFISRRGSGSGARKMRGTLSGRPRKASSAARQLQPADDSSVRIRSYLVASRRAPSSSGLSADVWPASKPTRASSRMQRSAISGLVLINKTRNAAPHWFNNIQFRERGGEIYVRRSEGGPASSDPSSGGASKAWLRRQARTRNPPRIQNGGNPNSTIPTFIK